VAVALSFIDCINRLDLDALADLMTDDHELRILDERPVAGRAQNVEAWRGYFAAFPAYVIYPERIAERGETVVILGHTTGSHLGLADEVEATMDVLWTATARSGRLETWCILDDGPTARDQFARITAADR
jgi:ketosteroid isomerase-like protein